MNTIAVVEDNLDNQVLFEAMLEERFAVSVYDSGQPALDAFGSDELPAPGLVLLDISLPGMDGIEVLRRLREIPKMANVPVVALTAHAMSGDRERFLAAGFDDYVAKPIVDEDAFYATLDRHLASSPA